MSTGEQHIVGQADATYLLEEGAGSAR